MDRTRRTGATYSGIVESLGLDGNAEFAQGIVDGLVNPESLRANEAGVDYYYPEMNPSASRQVEGDNWREALGEAMSYAATEQINRQRGDAAYEAYVTQQAILNGYGDNPDEYEPAMSRDEYEANLSDDGFEGLYGYEKEPFISVSNSGCVLYCSMYGANAMTGAGLTGVEANGLLRDLGAFLDNGEGVDTLLSIPDAMEELTGGEYQFDTVYSGAGTEVTKDMLDRYGESGYAYFGHVRLRDTRDPDNGNHSTMMSDYYTNDDGELRIILENPIPSDQGSPSGANRIEVGLDEIYRFDMIRAMPEGETYSARLENPELWDPGYHEELNVPVYEAPDVMYPTYSIWDELNALLGMK